MASHVEVAAYPESTQHALQAALAGLLEMRRQFPSRSARPEQAGPTSSVVQGGGETARRSERQAKKPAVIERQGEEGDEVHTKYPLYLRVALTPVLTARSSQYTRRCHLKVV